MTKREIKKQVDKIIHHKQAILAELKQSDNPQTKEMASRVDAEIGAFFAVSDALNNDNCLLNCHIPGV